MNDPIRDHPVANARIRRWAKTLIGLLLVGLLASIVGIRVDVLADPSCSSDEVFACSARFSGVSPSSDLLFRISLLRKTLLADTGVVLHNPPGVTLCEVEWLDGRRQPIGEDSFYLVRPRSWDIVPYPVCSWTVKLRPPSSVRFAAITVDGVRIEPIDIEPTGVR